MSNNVVSLPFEDLSELDSISQALGQKRAVEEFMGEINEWIEAQGVDISTNEYRHQAAVIMTQLQVILMGAK